MSCRNLSASAEVRWGNYVPVRLANSPAPEAGARALTLITCSKLKALPVLIMNLSRLQHLQIDRCPLQDMPCIEALRAGANWIQLSGPQFRDAFMAQWKMRSHSAAGGSAKGPSGSTIHKSYSRTLVVSQPDSRSRP